MQAEIDRLGFKWKAGWTSLSNLTDEQMKKRLGIIEDHIPCKVFPNYSGPVPQSGKKIWDKTEIKD